MLHVLGGEFICFVSHVHKDLRYTVFVYYVQNGGVLLVIEHCIKSKSSCNSIPCSVFY